MISVVFKNTVDNNINLVYDEEYCMNNIDKLNGYFSVYIRTNNNDFVNIGNFEGNLCTIALNLGKLYDQVLYFKRIYISSRYKDLDINDSDSVSVKINTEYLAEDTDEDMFKYHGMIIGTVNLMRTKGIEIDYNNINNDYITLVNTKNEDKNNTEKVKHIAEKMRKNDFDTLVKFIKDNNINSIDDIEKL